MNDAVMTELEELRAEVRSYREAFTAMEYAKAMARFHSLDGLHDGYCPACGSAVNLVENEYGTGVKLEPRWKP